MGKVRNETLKAVLLLENSEQQALTGNELVTADFDY